MPLPANPTPLDELAQACIAMLYLDKVEKRFTCDSEEYLWFLDCLGKVSNGVHNRDLPKLIAAVTFLLRDHKDLIDDFVEFLPQGWAMHSDPFRVSWLHYEWLIKTTYAKEPGVYEEFVHLCNNWWFRCIPTVYFMQRLDKLFKDHRELIEELTNFMPDDNIEVPPAIVVTEPDGVETHARIG